MTKVKICGNTSLSDVAFAIEHGADYVGFIFTESKRKIHLAEALSIRRKFPEFNSFVGVFANQSKEDVEKTAGDLGLQWLQFHGNETSRYCDFFTKKNYHVIKTFHVKDKMSLKRIDEYNVSAFLFDTYSRTDLGGTGITFDWDVVKNKPYVTERLFLAGGLTVDNVGDALRIVRPYAVDVASGVEKEPGIKDHLLLKLFIEKVKGSQ